VVATRLDDLDYRIIHALYVDARAPFSLLAEVLGASEQTVARRYRTLRDAGVVRVVGQLDSQRLGRSDWAVRIRCTPGTSMAVATELARRPETAWVQLTSGGTEIFSTIRSHGSREPAPLLLGQLSAGRQVVGLEAYCLLHLFTPGRALAPGVAALTAEEIDRLRPVPDPSDGSDGPDGRGGAEPQKGSGNRPVALHDADWPLVRALAEDGRATYRRLAAVTHWHETTVRRRMDELVGSGVLFFDLDVATDAVGVRSRALLWMVVAPANLTAVGEALAERPEVPFVAATTGSTNLVASVSCRDDRSLFEYLTGQVAALPGVTHVETAPIMRSVKMHVTMLGSG